MSNKNLISFGDFIDLYYKVRQKGYKEFLSKFHLSDEARVVSKWDNATSTSDFWMIPEVRKRWNEKCTGNPELEYEDYVVSKYFSQSHDLRMLSVGCGTGARERKFAKYPNFELIEGIEITPKQVEEARQLAAEQNLNNIKYYVGDFVKHEFEKEAYDVVLFNSSLHHFKGIDNLLHSKVLPLLKKGGFLILFEYAGPARLQWTKSQLDFANQLLKELPTKFKRRFNSNSIKNKIYRPGLLRMILVDPSESVDSDSIRPAVHKHFEIIEERKLGWDIHQLLFKDIAHNFLGDDQETRSLLAYLFEEEDKYMERSGGSDAIFGVYRKP